MDIRLKWVNPNAGEDGTRIYRSETPMDPQNLPAPLTSVAAGVSEFVDDTVERYKTYYYRFEAFKGNNAALSGERKMKALPYTGPGPQELIKGDLWEGYYGWVQGGRDFWRLSELVNALNFTAGDDQVNNEYVRWFKFAWRGKVLYFPFGPLKTNLSWDDIYEAGLVYGTNDNGLVPGTNPTNQLNEIVSGFDTFIPRLFTGDHQDPANSEWDQLYGRASQYIGNYQLGENWDNFTDQDSRDDRSSSIARYTFVQDLFEEGPARLLRGYNTAAGRTVIDNVIEVPPATSATSYCWWPVLELKAS